MAGILLTILKIVGIVLGCILLVVLLLLLAVLFCAVKYKAVFSYNEEFQGRLKVSWLFKIIFFRLEWRENRLGFCLRVFGIPILSSNRKKKEKPPAAKEEKNKYEFLELELEPGESEEDSNGEDESMPRTNQVTDDAAKDEKQPAKRKFSPAQMGERIREKLAQIKEKCLGIRDKIKEKCLNIRDKVKGLLEKAQDWKDTVTSVIHDQEMMAFFRMALKRLGKALKGILPRKYHLWVRYGGKDPAATGQMTGYYAIARSIFPLCVDFEPDFEQEVLMLKGYASGRVRGISLAAALLKIITHKQFKIIRRQLKQ